VTPHEEKTKSTNMNTTIRILLSFCFLNLVGAALAQPDSIVLRDI